LVCDLFTDENILSIPVETEDVEDISIFGVNRDWELPFLEEDGWLRINLGDLNQWIGVPDENGLKHIKLDIKYTLIDPEFEMGKLNLGYKGIFDLYSSEEMEIHITLPLGMKMPLKDGNKEITIISEQSKNKIKIDASAVKEKDRKRRYDFVIRKDEYMEIFNKESAEIVKLNYEVSNEKEYYVLTAIGLGLFVFALFRFFIILKGQISFDIRYLAAAVAFISLFLTLLREKYEIPFRKLLIYTTVFIGIELILELLFES
jgi:hypothetical protein